MHDASSIPCHMERQQGTPPSLHCGDVVAHPSPLNGKNGGVGGGSRGGGDGSGGAKGGQEGKGGDGGGGDGGGAAAKVYCMDVSPLAVTVWP